MNEITLMSFGFLYGQPKEASTLLDARGLPNPYWVETLRHRNGLDPEVRDHVFSTPEAKAYLETALALLRQRIAFHVAYASPLKQPLVLAVGCSGGKHRSVSMAYRLAEALRSEGYPIRVIHRDLKKRLEHSAGAVVFTREEGEPRFVIVRHPDGHHGFPKCHMEPGETERETALREIREETDLTPALLSGFRTADVYKLPNEANTWKQVVYFLAEYRGQPIRPRETELSGAALLTFGEAMSTLEHESSRRVLQEAADFLEVI